MNGKKILASVLCAALVCGMFPMFALAQDATADTREQQPEKTEVVYAKTNEQGSVSSISVVNGFMSTESLRISDSGSYESVVNLSTTEELTNTEGTVSFTTTASTPFYYQGNVSAQTQLPWDITVRYFLNDEEVSASDLTGAQGELKIELSVNPHKGATETNEAFANNYLVQAQTSFDSSVFNITEAQNSTLSYAGGTTGVTGIVLPGESQTFTLVGTAENFEYDGWQIAALPLNMALDIASQDTSALSSQTNKLESATASVGSAAATLASGSVSLASGITTLNSGLETLAAKNATLTNGWNALAQGIQDTKEGALQLQSGSNQFAGSVQSAVDEAAQGASVLEQAQSAYQNAALAAQSEIATSGTVSAQTFSTFNQAAQALAQACGSAGAYQALTQVQSGYTAVLTGIDSLAGGLSELESNTGAFESGLVEYTSGVSQAAAGCESAVSGSQTLSNGAAGLSDGTAQLVSATSGLDEKIINELQAVIDEKLGANFNACSFVDPTNTNVNAVQFVYVVDGVQIPKTTTTDNSSESETTLGERIVAVFENIFTFN